MLLPAVLFKIALHYETSMALVTYEPVTDVLIFDGDDAITLSPLFV